MSLPVHRLLTAMEAERAPRQAHPCEGQRVDREQLARDLGIVPPSDNERLRQGQARHALDALARQAARLPDAQRPAVVRALARVARALGVAAVAPSTSRRLRTPATKPQETCL